MKKFLSVLLAVIFSVVFFSGCEEQKPADKEVTELFKTAAEKVVLYWNAEDKEAAEEEFGFKLDYNDSSRYLYVNSNGEAFNADDVTALDNGFLFCFKTDIEYQAAVEKYSEIFTGDALEKFLKVNFRNFDGFLCAVAYSGTGIGLSEDISVEFKSESDGKYNYIAKCGIITGFDNEYVENFETSFTVEKTKDGYRISDMEFIESFRKA